MKEYRIKRVSGAPDWSNIPTLAVDSILWLPDANVRMTQQLCYDDTAIYVHQRVVEQHIRAEESGPMAMVCFDSCVEFFFCPDPGSDRYFNFEWNSNGGIYLGAFLLFRFNVRRNGVVLSATFMKLGLLVNLLISVLIFRERPGMGQIIGFCLAVGAIVLMNYRPGTGAARCGG